VPASALAPSAPALDALATAPTDDRPVIDAAALRAAQPEAADSRRDQEAGSTSAPRPGASAPAGTATPTTTPAPARGPRRRTVGIAAALTLSVVAGYVVVSGSFTFPASPANAAVNDVFAPYFAQRWDVFAPNMQKVNTGLSIQVQWRDDSGQLVKSDWVDVTGMELETVGGNPFPSRIAKNTANAVSIYQDRFDQLTSAQQDRVTDTFIEATDSGFQPIPDDQLISDIEDLGDGGNDDGTIPFLRYDYMLTRFATAFGEAYFGEDVERVRWRIDYQRPNDFDHRNDSEQQFSPSETVFGWRQPAEQPSPQAVADFADVIQRYSR
jgi:hypothetical protein